MTELRERDRARHAFLADEVDRLKDSAVRATELEQENKELAREINELRESLKQPVSLLPEACAHDGQDSLLTPQVLLPGRQETRQPLGELPLNVVTRCSTAKGMDASVLEKAHADLLKKFEVKKVAARTIKDQRDAWIKYAESLEKKVSKLQERVRMLEKSGIPTPVVQRLNEETDNLSGGPSLGSSFTSNPEQSSRPGFYQEVAEELRHSKRAISTPATSLSHQDPLKNGTAVPRLAAEETWSGSESETPDDLPRLPRQPDERTSLEVKQEPSSDGPVVVSERRLHKRKTFDNGFRMPPARRVKAEHNDSSDPIITAELSAFSPHSSIDLDAEQGDVLTPRKLRRWGVGTAISNALNTRHRQPLQEIPLETCDESEIPLTTAVGPSKPLIAPRYDATHDWSLANGVAELAEDRPVGLQHSSLRTGKLQALLNHTPSEDDATIPLRTPSARENLRVAQPIFADISKGKPNTPAKSSLTPNAAQSASKRRKKHTLDTRSPHQKPLRERPVSELRLDDFKINPKSNNGHKHAFNEVVRNRAERAELEGCTDPNCCGRAFSMMAQSELNAGGPDILKKPENTKLLEDYLADDADKLGTMEVDEKLQLWLEAKKLDYAKRLGRHRHRFGRPPSPPGYWNPDFPSTQEVEERRKEGQEMERKMVEERWREAMKVDGKWLFRDEQCFN